MSEESIVAYLAAHGLEVAGMLATVLGIWLTTKRLLICWWKNSRIALYAITFLFNLHVAIPTYIFSTFLAEIYRQRHRGHRLHRGFPSRHRDIRSWSSKFCDVSATSP